MALNIKNEIEDYENLSLDDKIEEILAKVLEWDENINNSNDKYIENMIKLKQINDHKLINLKSNYIKYSDNYFKYNYDFILMKYQNNPLLIVFGYMFKKSLDEKFSEENSIKFYNASPLIEKPTERYPVKQQIDENIENYPELLQREINLYKKGNSSIIVEADGMKIEGLNKLDNCKNFTIDSSLNYAAISLAKRQIVIIGAFPNLLDCKGKKMKTLLLVLPEKNGPNSEITNIKLGEVYIGKSGKKILYVSTESYLAYYDWNFDEKGTDDLNDTIQCKYLINDIGVSEGCLFAKNNSLLVACGDKFIY